MSKRSKVLVGAGAVVLIVGIVAISAGARRDRGQEVRFEAVGRRDLVAAVTASGKIQPKKKVDVSADITGRITQIAVREGDFVKQGQFLIQIDPTIYQANLPQAGATMASSQAPAGQAKVKVDEADVVRVHLGDSVEVSIDAFPDTVFIGRVTKVSNSSVRDATSSATGQSDRAVDYEVEITLDKPPTDIRPDLSATARIVTDTRKQALSIPIIALTVRENKPGAAESRPADTAAARKKKETEGVFVVKDGLANFRPVKVGIAGDEYFEVTDGLKPGETIVAGPYQAIRDLKEGARVRAMKQSADSAKKKATS